MAKSNKNITTTPNAGIIEPLFSIQKIELLNFSLTNKNKETTKEFLFDVQIKQEVLLKDKMVISKITLGIKNINEVKLADIVLSCIYEVRNINEILTSKSSIAEMSAKLNEVTISTARGVMFGLFRGTYLDDAVLPIFDVKTLQTSY